MSEAPRETRPADPPISATQQRDSPSRRLYIQGLRAIAVLMVVLFHAKLPIPGGFAGVDVFFVVSGFVITAMLRREWMDEGRIRLGRFYIRRCIRLAPALALMSLTTVLVSALLFSPEGSRQASATAAAATLFFANWQIAMTTSHYFGLAAEANPLLNTWSLSVEEQFYLIFPALLWASWRLSRRASSLRHAPQIAVALAGIASIAVTFLFETAGGPVVQRLLTGFYGPLGRVWEFAIGAALVFLGSGSHDVIKKIATPLSMAGASLLLISVFWIDGSVQYPGPWTLAPTLGTGLLVVSAGYSGNPIGRLLSSRPLVNIGDWSYSIYLWHWPFIAFAGLLWPGRAFPLLGAAAASLIPALVSYHWVEQPIRKMGAARQPKIPLPAVSLVGASLLVAVACLWLPNSYWLPGRLLGNARGHYDGEIEWHDHDYRFGGFHPCDSPVLGKMVRDATDYELRCQQSKPGPRVDLALLGDSHAEHLFIGISEALPNTNVMYFTDDAFPTLANSNYAAAVQYVNASPSIQRVIVTAFWSGRPFERDGLELLLRSLLDNGKQVMLTDGLPSFPFGPSPCKYHSASLCSVKAETFWERYEAYGAQLRAVVADLPEVVLLETAGYLCDRENCSMTRGDEIFYADRSHLNVLGSRFVGRRLVEQYRSHLVDSLAALKQ